MNERMTRRSSLVRIHPFATELFTDVSTCTALRTPGTIFSEKVVALAESLQVAILTYLAVSTRKRAGTNAFRPVLAPVLRQTDTGGKWISAQSFV